MGDMEGKKQIFSENCSLPNGLKSEKKIALRNFINPPSFREKHTENFSRKFARKSQSFHFDSFFQKQKNQRKSAYSTEDFFKESFLSGSIFSKHTGKFFPLKKDFLQYWGFPLLGFAFFFFLPNSQTSPFNSQNFFLFFDNRVSPKKTHLLENRARPQGFYFSEENFFHDLENFEKNEFEKFSKYYFEIFQKSLRNISTHQTEFQKLQNQVLENWKLESLKTHSFRNQLQTKKKSFSLKWYFLPSESGTLSSTSIPDQAQLFEYFEKNKSSAQNFGEKTEEFSKVSPLWNFSQLRFLVNENERNAVLSPSSQSEKYVQEFFTSFTEDQFQFFEFLLNSGNSSFFRKNTKESFPYLQKWLETQNLKKVSIENQSEKNSSVSFPTFKNGFADQHLASLDALFLKKYFQKSSENKESKNSLLVPLETISQKTSARKPLCFQKFLFQAKTFEWYASLYSKKKFQKIPNLFFLKDPKKRENSKLLNVTDNMFSFLLSPSESLVEKEIKKVGELNVPLLFHVSKKDSAKIKKRPFQFLREPFSHEKTPLSPPSSSLNFFQQSPSFFSQTGISSEYFQIKNKNSPVFFENVSRKGKNTHQVAEENFFVISQKFSNNFGDILLEKLQSKNIWKLPFFQTSFFVEKSQQKNPFIFTTSEAFQEKIKNLSSFSDSQYFLFSLTPKQKTFFSATGGYFQGKQKRKSSLLGKKERFSNLRSKKFEKVFRTFFFSSQKKNPSFLNKKEKNQNDKLLLNLFSSNFQKTPLQFSKKTFDQKERKKERSLPTSLLKRDAFVFHVWSPDSFSSSQMDERTHARIEKEKSFQRKRRLKKQKLETRRRKKRKRFFPRPVWLRFQLYKKFLKTRHPEQKRQKSSISNHKTLCLLPKISKDGQFQGPKKLLFSGLSKSSFLQKEPKRLSVQQKIFRTNTQKWGFYWKNGFQERIFYKKLNFGKKFFSEPSAFSGYQKSPISQKSDDYKISRDIFTDFLRFSWKSSWFQSNFPALQTQISQNFKKMKEVESEKNLWHSFGISFLGDRHTFNLVQAGPLFQKTPSSFANESFSKNLVNEKFSWYWNIQNTASEQKVYENFFGESSHLEQVQNLSEYNRFLYSRLSEFFKSMKSQEFCENSSLSNQNMTKLPSRKNENFLSNPSFFTKVALFSENFQIPSQPYFPAFSLFSSLFQNNSFKPAGEFPTLRSLWAFHKTNFFQFQEQNSLRHIWTEKKQIESLKSLKGAKQGVKFVKRFAESPAFQPFSFFADKNELILENGVKNRFLSSLKPENQKYFSKLDKLSLKKFQSMEEKCSVFGIQTLQENSKLSSRYLKFQLLAKKPGKLFDSSISVLNREAQLKSLPKNSAKSSLNFWWSSNRMENFSPFSFSLPSREISSSNQYFALLETQFFWFAAISFHLAILFTLFKLPEIRSLFKFQLLIFLKFSNAFFSILFAGANFFQISSMKGKETATKFSKFCSAFDSENSFTFSSNSYFSFYLDENTQDSKIFQSFSVPFSTVSNQKNIGPESQKDILFQTVFRVSNFSSSFVEKVPNSSPQKKIFKKILSFDNRKYSILIQKSSNLGIKEKREIPTFSLKTKSKIKTALGKNDYLSELIFSQFSLLVLLGGKSLTKGSSKTLEIGSIVSTKILDSFESVLVSFYKFLEKPAELIIEWIALIFLVEWSSDMLTFVPDTVDTSFSLTTKKFSRSLRFVPFFLHGSNGNFLLNFPDLLSVNTASFVYQKQVRSILEEFSFLLTQPDIDILVRQRKGMIFWDIWAEILLKTAEKYNVNIPSFVTLKEEQELFLEKLLQDQKFLESLQGQYKETRSFGFRKQTEKENTTDFLQQKSLASYMQNFLIPDRPNQFPQNQQNFGNSLCEYSILEQIFKNGQGNENSSSLSSFFKFPKFSAPVSTSFNQSLSSTSPSFSFPQDRWSAQQYVTYQGPESDLFIDIHPPVSFQHIPYFKHLDSAQPILGSLVCEIYGGLFSKQVAKNILVVGSQGTSKTLFLQALAGETEMKIITDNASRYATVQNGVAVGMKYLRDVFDALSFQTPCFFVMENIHLLGAKRPLLISDDEKIKVLQTNFGMDQQEVHETNQMMYELMRHSISDFRRPFKGDFSLGIPTNFYLQNPSFSDKTSVSVFPNGQFSNGGQNNFQRISPTSPFFLEQIEDSLISSDFSEKKETGNIKKKSFLQFSKEETFAPPATSPFTILMMKEQKKLKPKKALPENSWGGFSADQLLSSQKESSFVRSKVTTLAEMAQSSSRKKFDMITDLLVILDSVRSNRGFVVFATTHLPSLLDPALRRPGRFDEILSLAQTPNFFTRFEILKSSFNSAVPTFDLVDASIGTESFSQTQLLNLIQATKFSLFQTSIYKPKFSFSASSSNFSNSSELGLQKKLLQKGTEKKKVLAHLSPISSFQNLSEIPTFADFYNQKKLFDSPSSRKNFLKKIQKRENQNSKFFLRNKNLQSFQILPKGPSHELILAYSKIGIYLGKANILKDPTAFSPCFFENHGNTLEKQKKMLHSEAFSHSFQNSKYQLQVFLAGKVSESFLFSTSKILPVSTTTKPIFAENFDIFEEKFSFPFVQDSSPVSKEKRFEIKSENSMMSLNFWSGFGGDSTWRNAMPFLFFILQKRFLFTKNSLLTKMLFFENRNQQKQPPSPPNSSVSMPGKKYEQFKRTEIDFVQKGNFSMNQKIQMHQQQKFLKQLYNIPQQQNLFSEKFAQKKNLGSFQELAYLDSFTLRVSSSHFYYKKYFVQRHRFSHLNQWWNGFFPEHTSEATFLSDVDWRTMFGTSLQPEKSDLDPISSKKKESLKASMQSNFEFSMDFPDAEQYYNPRNRRWYFDKNASKQTTWFTFDSNLQYEIYYHSFFSVFSETFAYFDQNREYLDFAAFQLLQKGFLSELDYLTTKTRFENETELLDK